MSLGHPTFAAVPDEPLDLVWDPESGAFVFPPREARPLVEWQPAGVRPALRRLRRSFSRQLAEFRARYP